MKSLAWLVKAILAAIAIPLISLTLLALSFLLYRMFTWDSLTEPLLSDFALTWVFVLANLGACLRYVYRRRKGPSRLPFHVYGRTLLFYWPVYVWGLDSIRSFWVRELIDRPQTAVLHADAVWACLGELLASVMAVIVVVLCGAGLQLWFVKVLHSAAHGNVGVPLPVCATILGILGFESFVLAMVAWSS